MRKILSITLVVCLILTIGTSSVASVPTHTNKIHPEQMKCIVGGAVALDCNLIASIAAGGCAGYGGGWLTCAIVGAAAYLGCVAANALTPAD